MFFLCVFCFVCLVPVVVLFCSFLVHFTNLSWKEFNINNINILSTTWVFLFFFLIHVFCLFFVLFVWFLGWGGGGGLAFMKKTGVWGSILLTIYVLVYYILVFHFLQLWLLSLNVMWFHLLALLNLGSTSRLQGFIWRSADKIPAWKSEQLLVPCNWWHPLGACWSACKTKPLQTGVLEAAGFFTE